MNVFTQEELIKENELLTSIWTKPKLTLEFILTKYPKKYLGILITLGGIAYTLNGTHVNIAEHKTFSIAILVFAVFIGAIVGWLYTYIYAALLSWTGEWIHGHGEVSQFVTVISWAMTPLICSLILLLPKSVIFGDHIFSIDLSEQNTLTIVLYYIFEFIEIGLAIWSAIILITGISLIQKFNIGKAILNAILPILITVFAIFMIIGIIYLLK